MNEVKPESISVIKTQCAIPEQDVVDWIMSKFPSLGSDSTLVAVNRNYRGAVIFDIEHTKQLPQPAGPILLAPVAEEE